MTCFDRLTGGSGTAARSIRSWRSVVHFSSTSTHTVAPISPDVPSDLFARHLASTFVLVLDWWVDNEAELTPADVDARFRALVQPALSPLSR